MARSATDWIDLKKPTGWVTSLLAALIIFAVMNNPSKEDFIHWCDVRVVEDDGSESTTEPDKAALVRGGFFDTHLQRRNFLVFSILDFHLEGEEATILGIGGRFYSLWIRNARDR